MANSFLLLAILLITCLLPTDAELGVCYGRNGNNLPSQQDVINLYKSKSIPNIRIYDPDSATLQALKATNIGVILDVPNTDLQTLASDATKWVQDNIIPYTPNVNFRYIAVGNEVEPTDSTAQYVLPAMQNVLKALSTAGLSNIKVSTAVKSSLLMNTSPPSNSVISDTAKDYFTPIINFLNTNGAPLLANIYPYFSYIGDETHIPLNYALFTSDEVVVTDSGNGLQYKNLFDALVDCFYAVLDKAGASGVEIVVSESGWPSAGGDAATVENAGTYYKNLISHVGNGTPRKSGKAIDTYLFAMFDENQKAAGVEQNFGLFTPDQQPKYQISFT